MANMSYCRFENTYNDLNECYEALNRAGGVLEVEKKANQYEKEYVRKLINLCRDIVEEFGEDFEDD